jgi:hypothetical protein
VKRIAVILLLFIYSVSVYGVPINKFYCCSKLAYVGLFAKSINCPKKNKTDPSCCKSTKQVYKVKDSHLSVNAGSSNTNLIALTTPVYVIGTPTRGVIVMAISTYNIHAPPAQVGLLYIFYCDYRI